MIKKILIVIVCALCLQGVYASQLSRFFEKEQAKAEERENREWQGDMNFADMAFRLDKRYTNEHGDRCRDYVARSRSNPYRQAYYTICDER